MKKVLLSLALLSIVITGCDRNRLFIDRLEKFVSDVETNLDQYEDEEWVRFSRKFEEDFEVKYEDLRSDFTDRDLAEADKLRERFKELQLTYATKSYVMELEAFVNDIEERYDEYDAEDWVRIADDFIEKYEPGHRTFRGRYTSDQKKRVDLLFIKYEELKLSYKTKIFFEDLNFFIADAEAKYKDYNTESWQRLEDEFENDIMPRFNELRINFSEEDAKKANDLIAKYVELDVKIDVRNGKVSAKDLLERIKVIVSGLFTEN